MTCKGAREQSLVRRLLYQPVQEVLVVVCQLQRGKVDNLTKRFLDGKIGRTD